MTVSAHRRPVVLIVRRDGRYGVLATVEASAWYRHGDSMAAHFVLQSARDRPGVPLLVQVSGTALEVLRCSPHVTAESTEDVLPLIGECAIGDYLDGREQAPTPGDGLQHSTLWAADDVEGLFQRPPSSDAAILRYLASKVWWAKRLDTSGVAEVRDADTRRLGNSLREFRVVADTYEGKYWDRIGDTQPDRMLLRASTLLLQRGPRLVEGAVGGPVFDIREYLADPRHEASAQHFRKALGFLNADNPDYENAVSEAVRALESRARQMTGAATLGQAIKDLVARGRIPNSLGKMMTALYEYRNSMPGVGHGGTEPSSTSPAEARAMVNGCASALRYLLEAEPEV